MQQSNTSQFVIKHHARRGRSMSKGIITDEQCIEEKWKHQSMAQDSSAHSSA
jgi:hypothetical protein